MPRKAARRRSPGEGGAYSSRSGPGLTSRTAASAGTGRRSSPRRTGPPGRRSSGDSPPRRPPWTICARRSRPPPAAPGPSPASARPGAGWMNGRARCGSAPSTVASYRKNIRLHVRPYIGDVPLAALTTARIDRAVPRAGDHRPARRQGRAHRQGLSARTVRYIHTIVSAALAAAVNAEPPLLLRNPAAKASPPTASRPPGRPRCTRGRPAQLAAFLGWSADSQPACTPPGTVLAMTGMRRGELLALRWRDVDLDAATIAVRRSAGIVRNRARAPQIVEGDTKTGKPRVVDLDPATVAVLRALEARARHAGAPAGPRRRARVRRPRRAAPHPERVSRTVRAATWPGAGRLGDDGPAGDPAARPAAHARHACCWPRRAGHVVSERLGHASAVVTMTVYAHVMPGDQKRAADRFAALIGEACRPASIRAVSQAADDQDSGSHLHKSGVRGGT